MYFHDGTTRSKCIQRYTVRRINAGEIVHSVYDFNNGIVSFVLDSTKETIGECLIPKQFKGKAMIPLVYAKNKGDKFQIIP